MNIARPLDFTFKKHLQTVYFANDQIETREVRGLLSKFEELSLARSNIYPLLFVIDYTKSQYLVMTDGCQPITGYRPEALLEGGMSFLLDIFQKDDFRVYNEHVFTTNVDFLKSQPTEEHHNFIFSYNFRVRNKSGNYVPILQRGSYITSKETKLPLYSLGMIMDISHFKKDRLIYHTIEKTTVDGFSLNHQLIQENCFYPYAEDKILSVHERNILSAMAEGLSSKQIAVKFKIAENTVANHRKNMLKKTATKNVAELVAFACRNRLI